MHLLSQALDSVFAQTFTDYEVIVVDDGSTDGTRDYLSSLGNRVTVLSHSNGGPGAARNLGARYAAGDYFAFLDSDDRWFPWTLSCFADLIGRYDRPAILSARLMEFAVESELETVERTETKADVFRDYYSSYRHSYFVGSGMSVLRRDAFRNSFGYADVISSFEDHDLILRMGDASGFVQLVEPVTLAYRKHSESLTRLSYRSFEGARYVVRQEMERLYPGGPARAGARRAIITQRIRPVTVSLLENGLWREAWVLYRATFVWNFLLGRCKYLLGFPVKAFVVWISTTLRRPL